MLVLVLQVMGGFTYWMKTSKRAELQCRENPGDQCVPHDKATIALWGHLQKTTFQN